MPDHTLDIESPKDGAERRSKWPVEETAWRRRVRSRRRAVAEGRNLAVVLRHTTISAGLGRESIASAPVAIVPGWATGRCISRAMPFSMAARRDLCGR